MNRSEKIIVTSNLKLKPTNLNKGIADTMLFWLVDNDCQYGLGIPG